MSVNRVEISGNITRDAELRATQSGTAILNFTLAVNDKRKDASGSYVDKPCYVGCTMFGTRAEKLAPYFTKGTKLFVAGKLNYSSWEKDGVKHNKLDVIVDDFDFGGSRSSQTQAPAQQPVMAAQVADVADADIPF